MKTEKLTFKKLSTELEEVLMEKMVEIKGGMSDLDWDTFYEFLQDTNNAHTMMVSDSTGTYFVDDNDGDFYTSEYGVQYYKMSTDGVNWYDQPAETWDYDRSDLIEVSDRAIDPNKWNDWLSNHNVNDPFGDNASWTDYMSNFWEYLDIPENFSSTTITHMKSSEMYNLNSPLFDHLYASVQHGVISGQSGLFNYNTTITDGVVSSYDISAGALTVSYLAGGGFSVSFAVAGASTSVGLSYSQGLSVGNSLTKGNYILGVSSEVRPGGYAVLAAGFIALAIVSGGSSVTSSAPLLAPLF